MIKKFYVLVWFLLVGSVLTSIFTGTFDTLSLIAASLISVGLVYALALWAIFRNPQSLHTK